MRKKSTDFKGPLGTLTVTPFPVHLPRMSSPAVTLCNKQQHNLDGARDKHTTHRQQVQCRSVALHHTQDVTTSAT